MEGALQLLQIRDNIVKAIEMLSDVLFTKDWFAEVEVCEVELFLKRKVLSSLDAYIAENVSPMLLGSWLRGADGDVQA